MCPSCSIEIESFLCIVTCTNPTVERFRKEQQEVLWRAMKDIQTPPLVFLQLQNGIRSGTQPLEQDSGLISTKASISQESTHDYASIAHAAYLQQTFELGWDQVLRGRISTLWGEAAYMEGLSLQQHADQKSWGASLIRALLCYSQSL